MAQIQKLVRRLLSRPKDFSWDELVKVLAYFGYSELGTGKTGGSRRKFVDDTRNILSLHKPHPGNILKHYQLNEVIEHLKEKGKLNE